MRFLFLITVAAMLAYPAKGQTCTCESTFEWTKKTFEENDAGFQYIIDRKGQAAYNIHNQLMLEKIKAAKTLTECAELLNEWLRFFRFAHIGISLLAQEAPDEPEMWNGNISQFVEYISAKQEADYEGIWEIGPDKIGIKREGANYVGFIVETRLDT